MTLHTFYPGGIHIPDFKLSASAPIVDLAPVASLVLPLGQSIGSPSRAVVAVGQDVTAGQIIAEPSSRISAALHSPVFGVVKSVGSVDGPWGYPEQAVVISVGDAQPERAGLADMEGDMSGQIRACARPYIDKVRDAGLVGMGGATFPTHVKLDVPPGKVDTLVINAVECEPYLTCDHALMLSAPAAIVYGVRLAMAIVGASKAVIGIEDNKPDAIKALSVNSGDCDDVEVIALRSRYPQGGEKQLIHATLHREVPVGGLPSDVGVVVMNVATVYALYEALVLGQPLTRRIVTVTGPEVPRPANYRVPLGYPVRDLLRLSGVELGSGDKVVFGGPMMGRAVTNVDVPVTKGMSGILVLPASVAGRASVEPCVRCAKCVEVCPMGLEPYLISTLSRLGQVDEAVGDGGMMSCIECGSCSYVCPSSRPLLDYIRYGKGVVRSRKKR